MNKTILTMSLMMLWLFVACGSSSSDEPKTPTATITASIENIKAPAEGVTTSISVTASQEWKAYTDGDLSWIKLAKQRDDKTLNVEITANPTYEPREGKITLKSGTAYTYVSVNQDAAEEPVIPETNIETPEGYTLVWHDEFDEDGEPSNQWWYETGAGGWGNNEIQNYVKCYAPDGTQLATVKNGILTITLAKLAGTVYSIRMNTQEAWTYGYFEARLKLPKGKGTWPAFWMMPKNFKQWPGDGEIDIMEEVGYSPNNVSSSIHCNAYNHVKGTQKTKERYLEGAQDEFHVYAVEWTKDYIRSLVDGKQLFYFQNEGNGTSASYDVWPFYTPFYLKLNLAWGGNWGGAQGLDESCLPATYQIDYVRVFQKK